MATEFISNSWLMPTNANAEANRVSNYSLDFDAASSQYVNLGNCFSGSNNGFSISFWYFTSSYQVGQLISKAAGNFEIYHHTNGNAIWIYFGGRFDAATQIPIVLDSWQHIVYVVSETEYKGYQNGTLTVTNTFGATPSYTATTNDVVLGARNNLTQNWSGKLNEISFFDYEL